MLESYYMLEQFYQDSLECLRADRRGEILLKPVPDGYTDEQLFHYMDCRNKGTSPALSEMFALAVTPTLHGTDKGLWKNWTDNQFAHTGTGETLEKSLRITAEKHGVNTTGRRYLHSLAHEDYFIPGTTCDPKAWISDTGDVRRVLKERAHLGGSCEGAVTVKAEKE